MKQRNENINTTIRKGQDSLRDKIDHLEQENKELRDSLEKAIAQIQKNSDTFKGVVDTVDKLLER